jgi:hypothetical protein
MLAPPGQCVKHFCFSIFVLVFTHLLPPDRLLDYPPLKRDISNYLRHSTVQITSEIYADAAFRMKRKLDSIFDQAV